MTGRVIAALTALTGGAEVQLLPAGEFRAWDGRPKDVRAWRLTAAEAAAVAADLAARGAPAVIDYEHQTMHAKENGQPAPAAGWFHRVEWREGRGLFAVGVTWTEKARGMIAAGEYRYLSPVFAYDGAGLVTRLLHAALTNFPALTGMAALRAPPAEEPRAVALRAQAYQDEMRQHGVTVSAAEAVTHVTQAPKRAAHA